MSEEVMDYVFVVKKQGNGTYKHSSASDREDYATQLKALNEHGFEVIRSFRLPSNVSYPVITACDAFVEGTLQPMSALPEENLDGAVDIIAEELGIEIERVDID